MTKAQKLELRQYAKAGYDFKTLRIILDCSDSTIKKYIKIFGKKDR